LSVDPKLLQLEKEIPTCPLFTDCESNAGQSIQLSAIAAADPRRGTHDARILIVTEAPDTKSAKGVAYRGGTGTRIMRMFLRPQYRIGLDYPDYGTEGLPAFLEKMRIYQTSAVKCVLGVGTANLGERVITNCRQKFLDEQVARLHDLELILPMGRLATASVLHRPLGSVDFDEVIGRRGRGLLQADPYYGLMIVALPHPSGINRSFNPPVFRPGDGPNEIRRKQAFVRALLTIRTKLGSMGYTLQVLRQEQPRGPLDRF